MNAVIIKNLWLGQKTDIICLNWNGSEVAFHQLGPLGRVGLVVTKSVFLYVCVSVCPLPMRFFCEGGLVRSVPCPWTGADRASHSRGALKTGRCSELDDDGGGGGGGKKKIPSAPNKNIGANILIGRESWCLPYPGFKKKNKPFKCRIYG